MVRSTLVICFGDSLTAGFQSPSREHPTGAETPYGQFLQDHLGEAAWDGSEAFGVNISAEVPFKPKGGNRAERVMIEGREVIWYRTEIAGSDIQARETLVELPDGRKDHMWLQANSPDQLREILRQTESLKFTTRLSRN